MSIFLKILIIKVIHVHYGKEITKEKTKINHNPNTQLLSWLRVITIISELLEVNISLAPVLSLFGG